MVALVALSLVAERAWGAPQLMLEIKDPRITESSGVAASTVKDGVYFTHNDSGDTARFFRFTRSGVDAEFTVKGAGARDWEDMASARLGRDHWLYLGDIGDNGRVRKSVQVYRVREPSGPGRAVAINATYSLTYPDGAHDCEALIVDPASGDLWLVTKDDKESGVYRVSAPKGTGTYRLQRTGTLHPDTGLGRYGRLVTAGDADPAGKHVVLRTYSGALEYTVGQKFGDWWKQKPARVRMPLDVQGEAVCYTRMGQGMVTTSEGETCPVHLLSLEK